MLGIKIEYLGGYGAILRDLFQDIPWENYDWYSSSDEIIEGDKNLYLPSHLTSAHFSKLLGKDDYLVVFSKLEGMKKGAKYVDIKTYNQFLKSECEVIILITDSIDIDIYAKEEMLLKKFLDNARKIGDKVLPLTIESDIRTEMKAF